MSLGVRTRKVYDSQHKRILNDEVALNRLAGMRTKDFFGLGEDFFNQKVVLDAGCGNGVPTTIRLFEFGVSKVCAFDMGSDWIADAEGQLKKAGINKGTL